MSRLSTKQRRARRRRRSSYAVKLWLEACARVLHGALGTPNRRWFKLSLLGDVMFHR